MSDDNNWQDAIFAKLNELDDEIKRLRREQIENIKSIKNLESTMKKEIGRSTAENVAYTAGVSLMTAGITLAITDLTRRLFGTIVWIAGALFMILPTIPVLRQNQVHRNRRNQQRERHDYK